MANEEQNLNHDWDFDANLSGIQAPTGKGATQVPDGFYKVQVQDMYTRDDKPGRVIIKAIIAEGPFSGTVRTDGLNKPRGADDNVRYYWRAFAESVGFTPANLDAGEVRFGPASFVKKVAYVHYVPGDKSAPKGSNEGYDRMIWLAKSEWETQKKTAEAAGASEGGTVAAQPDTQSADDVLAGLDLG